MTTACPACNATIHARTWAPAELGNWFIEFYRCGAVYRYGVGATLLQPCQDVKP